MRPEDLDSLFERAGTGRQPEPELLDRITGNILAGLKPVRPMLSQEAIIAGLVLVWLLVGFAGAAIFGMYGIRKLSPLQSFSIFTAVGLIGALAASQSAAEMAPGSRRVVKPAVLVGAGSVLLLAVFAFVFRGYAMDAFVRQGVPCLRAGLLHAIPAAGGTWLILRRGFAVDAPAAGIAAGTLAGMAGITMLELHCPNLRAIHVMVWHVPVVLLSAAAGGLLARALTSRERSAARPS